MAPRLRPATLRDAPAIAALYAPFVRDTAISFEEVPPTADEMATRMAALLGRYPYLVAEVDGHLVGYAYASPHRARSAYRFAADVTVYVNQNAQARGFGRRLYAGLLSELRRDGLHRAYAGIALPNAPSVALHEAMGFAHIGTFREVGFKFGRWHDVGWWECDLSADPR